MTRCASLSLLLVLASCGSDPDADAGTVDAGATDAGADAGDVDAGTDVPSIADVLECGRNGAGGLARGRDASLLQRHDVDLAAFPEALCNDGTGAVFYVRPHEGDANRHRWVIPAPGRRRVRERAGVRGPLVQRGHQLRP